jgi:hypothetical protein
MSTTERAYPNPTPMSSRHPSGMTLTMATVHDTPTLVNTRTRAPAATRQASRPLAHNPPATISLVPAQVEHRRSNARQLATVQHKIGTVQQHRRHIHQTPRLGATGEVGTRLHDRDVHHAERRQRSGSAWARKRACSWAEPARPMSPMPASSRSPPPETAS